MTSHDDSANFVTIWSENEGLRRRHVTGNGSFSSVSRDCDHAPSLLVDISDAEDDIITPVNRHCPCRANIIKGIGDTMRVLLARLFRWRTNIMLLCIISLALYLLVSDPSEGKIREGAIDLAELEHELESGNPVRLVSLYKSPIDDKIYAIPVANSTQAPRDYLNEANLARTLKYHNIWTWADEAIGKGELFPETQVADEVLAALQTAKIVNVDVLDLGKYESGTSQKWLVTLEGGQKALMKIVWEEKGDMKIDGLCNYGYEIPTSEIAAFHLHRVLGFRNTPYVTGRVIDLRMEILPVASQRVLAQISQRSGSDICVVGQCHFCKESRKLCPHDSKLEVSLAYWLPRTLELHTFPPKYMPYSTPGMEEWSKYGFNNRTYCDKVRTFSPYEKDRYFYDLFDFAVLDTLMYHFDSKHYVISDMSASSGDTVRLDHGRAFCAYDRDDLRIFMAPLTQCCTLRRSTWKKLQANKDTWLRTLRQRLDRDPIRPVLVERWFPVLERRMAAILDIMARCAEANGGWDNVLVED